MGALDGILNIVFRHAVITQPGFVLDRFGRRLLRNVFLSESAVADVESKVSKEVGKEFLYYIGKEFGYNYAKMLGLPRGAPIIRDEVMKSILKVFESSYGSSTYYNADWSDKRIEIHGKNVIVCRKNGVGLLILLGSWAGLLSYIIGDKSIEGIKTKCEGRGDDECVGIFAKANTLGGDVMKYDEFQEKEYGQDYNILNKPLPFQQDYGLDVLSQVGIIRYSPNVFDVSGERFFPIEITLWYSLEKKLAEKTNLAKIVYEPTFSIFERFGRENLKQKYGEFSEAVDFTVKLFSALGWGINQTAPGDKNSILVSGFPWSPEIEPLGVPQYFLGSLSGLLSGLTGRKIRSELISTDKKRGTYSVVLKLAID